MDEDIKLTSASESSSSRIVDTTIGTAQANGNVESKPSSSPSSSSGKGQAIVMEEKDSLLFSSNANPNLTLVMPAVSESSKNKIIDSPSVIRRKSTIEFSPRAKEVKISPTAVETSTPVRTTTLSIWGDEVATTTNTGAPDPDDDTLVYVVNSGIEMLENSATALEYASTWLDEASLAVENDTYALIESSAAWLSSSSVAMEETASWFSNAVSSAMGMDESQIDTTIETTVTFDAPSGNVIRERDHALSDDEE